MRLTTVYVVACVKMLMKGFADLTKLINRFVQKFDFVVL